MGILKKHKMGLTPDSFYARLKYLLEKPESPQRLKDTPFEFIVAYSGGLDSVVLLYLMRSIQGKLPLSSLKAVYIDHGLQSESKQWGQHCKLICERLKVTFDSVILNATANKGESPEDSARKTRYDYFKQHCVQKLTVLLTAHHADDQTETLLLQLLRGSGPKGLASMPNVTQFGQGQHLRPLLKYDRALLKQYATSNGLSWVDDPSNADTGFDRNFLRHKVLPVLTKRWPSLNKTTYRSAKLAAEADALLVDLASIDYEHAKSSQDNILEISALKQLSTARARNLIRYWIKYNGFSIPSYAQTEEILNMLTARIDATPLLAWNENQVRRFRSKLYLLKAPKKFDTNWQVSFDVSQDRILLADNSSLLLSHTVSEGLDFAELRGKNLVVKYRRGGETCTPLGRKHRHRLKKLFNEADIPPWERDRIPLIFVDDLLVAVVGMWYCEPYALKKVDIEKGLSFKVLFN